MGMWPIPVSSTTIKTQLRLKLKPVSLQSHEASAYACTWNCKIRAGVKASVSVTGGTLEAKATVTARGLTLSNMENVKPEIAGVDVKYNFGRIKINKRYEGWGVIAGAIETIVGWFGLDLEKRLVNYVVTKYSPHVNKALTEIVKQQLNSQVKKVWGSHVLPALTRASNLLNKLAKKLGRRREESTEEDFLRLSMEICLKQLDESVMRQLPASRQLPA